MLLMLLNFMLLTYFLAILHLVLSLMRCAILLLMLFHSTYIVLGGVLFCYYAILTLNLMRCAIYFAINLMLLLLFYTLSFTRYAILLLTLSYTSLRRCAICY